MEELSEKILELFNMLYPDWNSKFILPKTDLKKLAWIKRKIQEETNMMSREDILSMEERLRKNLCEIVEMESGNFFMPAVKRSTKQTADACIEIVRQILNFR